RLADVIGQIGKAGKDTSAQFSRQRWIFPGSVCIGHVGFGQGTKYPLSRFEIDNELIDPVDDTNSAIPDRLENTVALEILGEGFSTRPRSLVVCRKQRRSAHPRWPWQTGEFKDGGGERSLVSHGGQAITGSVAR